MSPFTVLYLSLSASGGIQCKNVRGMSLKQSDENCMKLLSSVLVSIDGVFVGE